MTSPEVSRAGGLAYGHVSMMGRRRVMEDALTAGSLAAGEYSFFAVYDGHGGAVAAEVCGERLQRCLEKHIEEDGFDWKTVMEDCFGKTNDELLQESDVNEGEDVRATAVVVVVVGREEVVVAANCGDSRAVLCRGGEPVTLSRDHKPERPDEKETTEAAGGSLINRNGWRVRGLLPTSRSLGDRHLKPYVSSEPEVTVTKRSESDDFLIIASDGLWDVVSNDVACRVTKSSLDRETKTTSRPWEGRCASKAAAMLAELAIARGSTDNITVIVVLLQ